MQIIRNATRFRLLSCVYFWKASLQLICVKMQIMQIQIDLLSCICFWKASLQLNSATFKQNQVSIFLLNYWFWNKLKMKRKHFHFSKNSEQTVKRKFQIFPPKLSLLQDRTSVCYWRKYMMGDDAYCWMNDKRYSQWQARVLCPHNWQLFCLPFTLW